MLETTDQLIEEWLTDLAEQGKSPATLAAYRRGIQHLISWSVQTYQEPFDPAATLPRDLERWKTYQLRQQNAAPATVNQRVVAVTRFFGWAVFTHRVASDPTRTVKTLRLEKHQPRSITPLQLNRLLRAVHKAGDQRDIAIIELLAGTGIRSSELLQLHIGDLIDLEKRSAHLIVRQGKHGHPRSVPLTRTVRTALSEYLQQHPDRDNPHVPLWVGQRGSFTQSSSLLRLLDKYCIRAGIEKVTPHQLRHTFATRYLQKNPDDLRGLAALLGHADLNTVMLYTEPTLDDLVHRMERTDNL